MGNGNGKLNVGKCFLTGTRLQSSSESRGAPVASRVPAQNRQSREVIQGSGPLPVFLKLFSSQALKYAQKAIANDSAIVLQGWNRYCQYFSGLKTSDTKL